MARSISEIYDGLIVQKQNTTELNGLTSTSQTALWNLMIYLFAVAINLHEQFWDLFKKDLEKIRDESQIATAKWWIYKMKLFQFAPNDAQKGVLVIGEDLVIRYTTVDATKQIIKFVSVTASTSVTKQVNIKVAKSVNGLPAQLTQSELKASQYYSAQIQPVGLFINTVSFPADILTGNIGVYYNGLYVDTIVETNVRTAIDNYLNSLEFDGVVKLISLVDAIQNVEGVQNVVVTSIFGAADGGSPESFLSPGSKQVYSTNAGYMVQDTNNLILNLILDI